MLLQLLDSWIGYSDIGCNPPISHKICTHSVVCRLFFWSSSSSAFETARGSGYILKSFTSLSRSVRGLFSTTFFWRCVMLFSGQSYICKSYSRDPGWEGNSRLVQHKGNGCLSWDFLLLQKEAAIVLYVIMPCWVNACQSSLMMLLLHYANCIFEAL